ncbi:MAG TPA: hypothetical protein EYP23_04960 [Thermoplasmata archaeon]|nr:hypothetical protein [Thermoplasmata archaeon]
MNKFLCVECGRETTEISHGMCPKCYAKKVKLARIPPRVHLIICSHCGTVKHKNIWKEETLDNAIKRVVENTLSISSELTEKTVSISCKSKGKNLYLCNVAVTGFLKNHEVTEQHSVEVVIDKQLCRRCSRKAGRYFEAILQIRAEKREPTDKEIQTIVTEVKENITSLEKQGKQVFVTEIVPAKGGVDLYMSDKGFTKKMMQMLHHRFGGETKTTAKQSGMKNGKQRYRMTYLVRLPYYQKGDLLAKNEQLFYLKSIERGKPQLVNLSNWDEVSFEPKAMNYLTVVGGRTMIKEAVVVSQTPDDVQILDPDTFHTRDVKKPKQVKLRKTTKIVKWRDRIYLFPYENL